MIVLDVETTGLNPEKHSIVSIGAVDFHYPLKTFYKECKIWDGAEITQEALNINGFKEEDIKNPNKKSQKEMLEEFLTWANQKDKTLAGENPSFDRDFLAGALKKSSLENPFSYRTVDLHTLVYAHYKQRAIPVPLEKSRTAINTDRALVYVGLPEEPRPHNALTGAKMEAEAFYRIIYGINMLDEFAQYKIPNYLQRVII